MAHNSIFRIFSMTKPIVSVGVMMLLEEGRFLLSDPIEKYIPEFSDQKVGVENNGKLELVPLTRPVTVHDLLRHTSGITYDHTGNGLVQQLYQQVAAAQPQDHQRRTRHAGRQQCRCCASRARNGITAAPPTF